MDKPRIFVSHSHSDNAITERLVADLRGAGAEVWFDVASLLDGNFMQRINEALSRCEWFVLVQSPRALQSPAVRTEVDTAIVLQWHQQMRGVIPFMIELCDPSEVPPTWRVLHFYDATQSYQRALSGLLKAIGLQAPQDTQLAGTQGPPRTDTVESSKHASATAPRGPTHTPADQVAASSTPLQLPDSFSNLGFKAHNFGGSDIIIPPVCDIPAGSFVMGSDRARDPQADSGELPAHAITLRPYQIGRFPVTVAEYACAVRAGAVAKPTEPHGISWVGQQKRLDHPVVCVLWQDAAAYAYWLAKMTGLPWRLPTEAEWERAARGSDARVFPWGNHWDATRANTSESGIRDTTAIGRFPTGRSPFGLEEMAGNVFEWCSSTFAPYPYVADARHEEMGASGNKRVVRGGAWGLGERYARAAARIYFISIDMVLGLIGFRLACDS